MREEWRRRLSATLAAAVGALMLSPQFGAVAGLPERLVLRAGGAAEVPASAVMRARVDAPVGAVAALEGAEASAGTARLTAACAGEAELTYSLLGLLPVRRVKVSVAPSRVLVPGGQSVGVAINADGVVVVGASDLGNTPSPARLAGIKAGDVIQKVDGVAVTSARQLAGRLSDGESARLELLRGGAVIECSVSPALDARDGQWRLGAWVRDSTAGVGTLTFYDPLEGGFGALGHAITDVDTGVLMPVGEGEIYENSVVEVTRSSEGQPGELTGDFLCSAQALGSVRLNSEYGIFGDADAPLENPLYPEGLPIASRSELHPGPATLLTTVEGAALREYACEIVRLSDRAEPATRSLVVRVTDPELLERTGGIVQGMSGSPLIQDGKLAGAVTHVMVNDPAMGYGIGIEAMLDAAAEASRPSADTLAA